MVFPIILSKIHLQRASWRQIAVEEYVKYNVYNCVSIDILLLTHMSKNSKIFGKLKKQIRHI